MRVSSNLEPDILSGIQSSQQSVQQALQEISTGQRAILPGDDPVAAAAMVQNLAAQSTVDQYSKNADSALGEAQTADSALTTIVNELTQAVSLGTEGANSTVSATQRQSLASQVQGILASVVSAANVTYGGVAVFGGTSNVQAAFVADPSSPSGYSYQGNSGANEVQVGDSLSVQTSIPGSTLFNGSGVDVLGSISQLASALASGDSTAIGNATSAITGALNHVTDQHVVYGNAINQLNSQETFLSQETITLTSQAQSITGIDTATAAENLTQAETQNAAMLAAAAKIQPMNLLDYLK